MRVTSCSLGWQIDVDHLNDGTFHSLLSDRSCPCPNLSECLRLQLCFEQLQPEALSRNLGSLRQTQASKRKALHVNVSNVAESQDSSTEAGGREEFNSYSV